MTCICAGPSLCGWFITTNELLQAKAGLIMAGDLVPGYKVPVVKGPPRGPIWTLRVLVIYITAPLHWTLWVLAIYQHSPLFVWHGSSTLDPQSACHLSTQPTVCVTWLLYTGPSECLFVWHGSSTLDPQSVHHHSPVFVWHGSSTLDPLSACHLSSQPTDILITNPSVPLKIKTPFSQTTFSGHFHFSSC